jgi:hypothetical protein
VSISAKQPLHHASHGPPPRSGEVFDKTPPRNGEGDRRTQSGGGGVLSASSNARKIAKRERRSGNLPEVLIWRELRKRPGGHKFRRQHPLSEIVLMRLEDAIATIVAACNERAPLHHQPSAGGPPPRAGEVLVTDGKGQSYGR